jgi:hypothetical protein
MNYLFLNGFHTPEAEEELKNSGNLPLVRELVFKFELRVLRKVQTGWMMCHKNGIVVGKATTVNNDEGKTEYQYFSPYFTKARGTDKKDKQTLHSTKLGALMGLLKKHNAILTEEEMEKKTLIPAIANSVFVAQRAQGSSYKRNDLQADVIHALLAHFFGENPNSLSLSVPIKECKDLFDKYNEADRVEAMKQQIVMDMFHKPFYIVGVDGFNDISIGKLKVTSTNYDKNDGLLTFETVEPYRRYSNVVESYPDIMPILTMVKVSYGNFSGRLAADCIPIVDEYNAPLSAAFSFDSSVSHYDSVFMVTPC